jgi:hypothetical protein
MSSKDYSLLVLRYYKRKSEFPVTNWHAGAEKVSDTMGPLVPVSQKIFEFSENITLVPEAHCEAKETRGEKEEPLVTSVANPTSTLD